MKLDKKKQLAARTLKVGKGRIIFDNSKFDEIKEAITRQDIRDLVSVGAIKIKEEKGRRKKKRRRTKRREGKIKKKIKRRKQKYVKLTRKLRDYIAKLKKQGKISKDQYYKIRKKIRAKDFRSKAHLKEYIKEK